LNQYFIEIQSKYQGHTTAHTYDFLKFIVCQVALLKRTEVGWVWVCYDNHG